MRNHPVSVNDTKYYFVQLDNPPNLTYQLKRKSTGPFADSLGFARKTDDGKQFKIFSADDCRAYVMANGQPALYDTLQECADALMFIAAHDYDAMTIIEQNAWLFSFNRRQLKKRLHEAVKVLQPYNKKYFVGGKVDYRNKRIIGTNGYYIQWKVRHDPAAPIGYENQQTLNGSCSIERVKDWHLGNQETNQGR